MASELTKTLNPTFVSDESMGGYLENARRFLRLNQQQLNQAFKKLTETSLVDITRGLIDQGADINYQESSTDLPPIWTALKCNQQEQVKLLIEKKANLNITDGLTTTLLMYAINMKYTSIAKLLLDAQTYDVTNELMDVTFKAFEKNNTEMAKLLLEHPAISIDSVNSYQSTLLHIAILNQNIELVELLLNKGCDYTINLQSGFTMENILFRACRINNNELVKLLLSKCPKININSTNKYEYSALYIPCDLGNVEIAKMLLDAGADPNITPKDSFYNPLVKACSNNRKEIVELLLKHPQINTQIIACGTTALIVAENNKYYEIVKLLKNHKAPIKLTNKDGKEYPMLIAKKILLNVDAICSGNPIRTSIIIPANTIMTYAMWDEIQEQWIGNKTVTLTEAYTIEIVTDKIAYHDFPTVGYVRFDSLTMPDHTVKKSVDLYH